MKEKHASHGSGLFVKIAWQSAVILAVAVLLGIISNRLREKPLPLFTDSSSHETQNFNREADDLTISLEEAKEFFYSHEAVFIDARPKEFYDLGHIAGAKSLPYEEFDRLFPSVMKDVDKETVIITYCDGKHCHLSRDLALALMDKGYLNVFVLPNGWTAWKEARLPVQTSPGH